MEEMGLRIFMSCVQFLTYSISKMKKYFLSCFIILFVINGFAQIKSITDTSAGNLSFGMKYKEVLKIYPNLTKLMYDEGNYSAELKNDKGKILFSLSFDTNKILDGILIDDTTYQTATNIKVGMTFRDIMKEYEITEIGHWLLPEDNMAYVEIKNSNLKFFVKIPSLVSKNDRFKLYTNDIPDNSKIKSIGINLAW